MLCLKFIKTVFNWISPLALPVRNQCSVRDKFPLTQFVMNYKILPFRNQLWWIHALDLELQKNHANWNWGIKTFTDARRTATVWISWWHRCWSYLQARLSMKSRVSRRIRNCEKRQRNYQKPGTQIETYVENNYGHILEVFRQVRNSHLPLCSSCHNIIRTRHWLIMQGSCHARFGLRGGCLFWARRMTKLCFFINVECMGYCTTFLDETPKCRHGLLCYSRFLEGWASGMLLGHVGLYGYGKRSWRQGLWCRYDGSNRPRISTCRNSILQRIVQFWRTVTHILARSSQTQCPPVYERLN